MPTVPVGASRGRAPFRVDVPFDAVAELACGSYECQRSLDLEFRTPFEAVPATVPMRLFPGHQPEPVRVDAYGGPGITVPVDAKPMDRGDGLGIDTSTWTRLTVTYLDGALAAQDVEPEHHVLLGCWGAFPDECVPLTPTGVAASGGQVSPRVTTRSLGVEGCRHDLPVGVVLAPARDHPCRYEPIQVVAPRRWAEPDCDGDGVPFPDDCDDSDGSVQACP